jgi:hypothetical protein
MRESYVKGRACMMVQIATNLPKNTSNSLTPLMIQDAKGEEDDHNA